MAVRLLELSPTSLFGENAILISLSGREEISKPFEFMLSITSTKQDLLPQDVIGKQLTVTIDRGNNLKRHINGYISHLWTGDFSETSNKKSLPTRQYRVRLVPWIWFMSQASRSYVYLPEEKEKSILQVIDKLFERVASYAHVQVWKSTNAARLLKQRKVEHCVQYRETDLNFLSRMLEQFGVYYYFDHSATEHTLVMSDLPNYPMCAEAAVECRKSEGTQEYAVGVVRDWEHAYEFVPGKYAHTDYNFTMPSTSLLAQATKKNSAGLPNNAAYEIYDSDGEYQKKDDGETEADRRQEEAEVRYDTVQGSSTCRTFAAGHCFKLTKHHSCKSEANKSYLLTSVQHHASQPGEFSGAGGTEHYENHFACVPMSVHYRQARITPKPCISSVQTAVVVGPDGEEIYTDKYGRVKVQFHWDREGKRDDKTSCWIRCQQNIAGNKWGFMAIPRIGQEVVVDFIEGDPDRPLITGCVYNAEQMPHYKLPDEKTKTYIKTNSSKGGEGHNELMFEDKANDERVYIHAQKNMDVRVRNDSKERIFGNRHQIIGWEKDGKKGGDQRELVYEDKHLNVKRHQFEHIEGNLELLVGEGEAESGGNLDLSVEKQHSVHIGGDSHLTVKGDHLEKIDGGVSSTIGGDANIQVNGNIAQQAGATGEIHLKAGMKIIIEAGMQLSLIGPGGFVDIGPAGVTIQGIMVNINSGGSSGKGKGCKVKPPKEAKKAKPAKPEIAHNSTSGSKSTKK